MLTLNGMFSMPKPHRVNYVKENKKKLKELSSMVYQKRTKNKMDVSKVRSSQTEISKSTSESSTTLRDSKHVSSSSFRLSSKGSMAVFVNERKDKGDISNTSFSLKRKSSQRVSMLKNQASQTIDPRRCDQLYHDGIIKYPSNKVLQELAEIERQKAKRLDAHVKKEYFKRNKIKQKTPKMLLPTKIGFKGTGKGDERDEIHVTSSEDEKEELDEGEESQEEDRGEGEKEKPVEPKKPEQGEEEKEEKVKEVEPVVLQKLTKSQPQPVMRAAEIIRKTTEDIKYSPKTQSQADSTKDEMKLTKKVSKKLSKEEEVLKTVLDPQCPPGHIPLPDTERKKTLHMLRVSHAELVREMNLLPIRTDTLRVRQRKIQLENQLNKIEEGIKVFNKSKVYVKIEE